MQDDKVIGRIDKHIDLRCVCATIRAGDHHGTATDRYTLNLGSTADCEAAFFRKRGVTDRIKVDCCFGFGGTESTDI